MKKIIIMILMMVVGLSASVDRTLNIKDRELKNYENYNMIDRTLNIKDRELKNYKNYNMIDRALKIEDREVSNYKKIKGVKIK